MPTSLVPESIRIGEPVDQNEVCQFETNNIANSSISTDNRFFVKQMEIGPKSNSLESSHEVEIENIDPEIDQGEIALHKSEEHGKYVANRPAQIYPGEKSYESAHCNKKFEQSHHLEEHLRIHTGEKRFKCGFCDKTFTESGSLKKHERIHTGEKPYKCGSCDKIFAHSQQLKMHERAHTGEKPYSCKYCLVNPFLKFSSLLKSILNM